MQLTEKVLKSVYKINCFIFYENYILSLFMYFYLFMHLFRLEWIIHSQVQM